MNGLLLLLQKLTVDCYIHIVIIHPISTWRCFTTLIVTGLLSCSSGWGDLRFSPSFCCCSIFSCYFHLLLFILASLSFLNVGRGILKSHKNLRVLMRHCQKWLYKKFTSSPSSRWNYNRLSYIARQTRNKFSIGHGDFSSVTWGKCTSSRQIYFVYQ